MLFVTLEIANYSFGGNLVKGYKFWRAFEAPFSIARAIAENETPVLIGKNFKGQNYSNFFHPPNEDGHLARISDVSRMKLLFSGPNIAEDKFRY